MMVKELHRKMIAVVLSALMVVSAVPLTAMAGVLPGVPKEITALGQLSDDIRWQNTTVPVFPENVTATVESRSVQVPVGWETEQVFDADYPVRGLYIFEARFAEEYVLADGVEPLIIAVFIPETVGRFAVLRMGGSGTSDAPLEITTAAQLAEIATLVNAKPNGLELFLFNDKNAIVNLKLMNDIDLSPYGKNYDEGKGWKPIGKDDTSGCAFIGNFDGNGKVITGLYINRPEERFQGLFGVVTKGAVVKTLGLERVHITGKKFVGGVVGFLGAGVGKMSTVENCYVSGVIKGSENVGGLVGDTSGIIDNCYSTASISGKYNVGGIAGYIGKQTEDAVPRISYCAALNPDIASTTIYVGRIVGNMVSDEFLANNIAFSGMKVNGIELSSPGGTASDKDGEGKSAADLQTAAGFPSALTSSPWTYGNRKLPGFGAAVEMPAHIVDIPSGLYFLGSGTEISPYQISTADQLAKLAELVNGPSTNEHYTGSNGHYKLMNDIDLSAYGATYGDGKGWVPIGLEVGDKWYSFKGVFDGDGKIISGLYINRPEEDDIGLFGLLSDEHTSIKNLGLIDVNVAGNDCVGGIAGRIENATIEGCYADGNITGNSDIGGIGGILTGIAKIKNCYTAGSVVGAEADSANVGGIAGDIGSSISGLAVTYCYSTASIDGVDFVGGVVGSSAGIVQNCVAMNPQVAGVNSASRVGGSSGGAVISNYAFSGTKVLRNGALQNITGGNTNNRNWADIAADDIFSGSAFWSNADKWEASPWDTSIWTIEDGKLPILKKLPAGMQSSDGGLYLRQRDIGEAEVVVLTEHTYNGREQIPDLQVTFDNQTLAEGTDYTVEITSIDGTGENPTSAGTQVGTVTLTITGIGDYNGSQTATYIISQKPKSGGGSSSSGDIAPAPPATGSEIPVGDMQTGGTVSVELSSGSLLLDEEATASIASQAIGDKLEVTIERLAANALTPAQQESVREGDIVLDISIRSGGKNISTFDGLLTVKIPYDGPLPVAVWYLNDAGELEKLRCTYENGIVTLVLDHLSLYIVGQDTEWQNPFADVKEGDWFYDFVQFVFQRGLMKGVTERAFSPSANASRGMIVAILHRLAGSPAPKADVAANSPFADVNAGQYYTEAVLWAAEQQVITGFGDRTFRPDDAITREQLAVIVSNYAEATGLSLPKVVAECAFDDAAAISAYAAEAVAQMQTAGILSGKTGNAFDPLGTATRAEVSAVLQRFVPLGE